MNARIALLALLPIIALAQPAHRSPYLANPSLLSGYVDSCAAFWTKAYDAQYGGYYTNVGRSGNIYNSAKNTMNLSRDAYGFVRAYQMTGKQIYLTHARQALQFMYAHSWDATHGGWYNSLDRLGNPSNSTENKTAFYQHYALLGPAAMFEATRDSVDWAWLMKGYGHNESTFWDARPGSYGYFDLTTFDGSMQTNKSFNATVDAVTTHVLHLYLMTRDSTYLRRLKELGANMSDRLVASMPGQAIGFVEGYTDDWSWDPAVTMTIMGHVLKTSWCFARLYQLTGDTTYRHNAVLLTDHVLSAGYDHAFGGPYKDYDRTTGQMLMWGIADTAKAWWQMEQAVVDGLMLYQITGKQEYLTMADETLDFFMKYFVDHTYGEVYSDRTRYGAGIPAWGDTKGNDGKAGYHSIETGYYAYLYQSLMVAHSTASLYYSIATSTSQRTFIFRPITYPDYRIQSALLEGVPLNSINQSNSTIALPGGTGGTIQVTYEYYPSTTYARAESVSPQQLTLMQNYPNPFNPTTTIRYNVGGVVAPSGASSSGVEGPAPHNIRLSIYDLLGREVAVLVDGEQSPGVHSVTFDAGAAGLSSGTYLYRIMTAGGAIVKKMLFLR